MNLYDYDRWPNFTWLDLACKHTGKENPNIAEFTLLMDKVQSLRVWAGVPFYVNSGYRHPTHPIESRKVAKGKPAGMHAFAAIDFRVSTKDCHRILGRAFEVGFTGIGVNLTGSSESRFIHLDMRNTGSRVWSY